MKNLLVLLCALLLTGIANTTLAQTAPAAPTKATAKASGDYIVMKNGKMMMNKDGKMMPMTSDMTMSDGSVGMTNGTCQLKDGTTMKMKEGQRMMMDGNMSGTKKSGMMKEGKMGNMNHQKM